MLLIGYDIGSSSVKASLLDAATGKCLATAFHPKEEMKISSPRHGWAEQDPDAWWESIKITTQQVLQHSGAQAADIVAAGISYQMHGLVLVDKDLKVLRPSIIWCDSRAVETGEKAFRELGADRCLNSLLNSPGNFTASKLKWVKDNEPEIYDRIYKMMLPGDYIAMRMTGTVATTPSGLSEGILWDFNEHEVSTMIMKFYGFESSFIPDLVPNIGLQGTLTAAAATELGLKEGTPLTYRAGDQPNNAFSLNVLNPGEIAATAGTSGVVFGVSDKIKFDPRSRVNTFAHVNHTSAQTRLGVLLCINGTGSLNSWLKRNVAFDLDYEKMNELSASVEAGAEGLRILPFGNGAERIIENRDTGCIVDGLNFNRHSRQHIIRAAHEGIVYSFYYGMNIMKEAGILPSVIRAGHSNMFLSPVFRQCLASISNTPIELYNTDGSQGAARAAGIGAGIFNNQQEAFTGLERIKMVDPIEELRQPLLEAFQGWETLLKKTIE
jgi:xylulokinase